MVENIKWLTTEDAEIRFEDNKIGRIKKEVYDATPEQLDKWLKEDFEIPSPSELGMANTYIQTTPRHRLIERRRKNDIVFLPVGSTECHGDALATGQDIFQVTQFLEGVRRYTAKQGHEVNLAYPILYGGHPAHHLGMAGTIVIPQDVLAEQIIAIMLGLWNDGFRKIILVNNHGQQWTLVTAVQEFCKRYQLPGIYQVFDWPHVVRDFFRPNNGTKECFKETFSHAGESEASLGLLMFPWMCDMDYAVDTKGMPLLDSTWFDNSISDYGRPHQWFEGEGHAAIEMYATPEGVVGTPSLASAEKAKRPVVAMMKLMVELVDEILEAYPAGKVPDTEKVTLRDKESMIPYLKEPMSEGWKSVYGIPRIGAFEK